MTELYKTIMKCGHSANSWGKKPGMTESIPACAICSCFEQDKTPNLEGRTARCASYGRDVKSGSYNGNACNVCKRGGICQCEKPSSLGLWFFEYRGPGTKHYMGESEHDVFYCACQGAD